MFYLRIWLAYDFDCEELLQISIAYGRAYLELRIGPFFSWIINDQVTLMVHLKFISLFTLSHGSNRNQQGGVSLQYGLRPFVVAWWHFHVAGLNLEKILQHLTKKQKKKKNIKMIY